MNLLFGLVMNLVLGLDQQQLNEPESVSLVKTLRNPLFEEYIKEKPVGNGGLKASAALKSVLSQAPSVKSSFPASLTQQTVVNNFIASIDKQKTKDFLVRLTQFPERHYQTDNGVAAAGWILKQVESLQSLVSPDTTLTVRYFKHGSFKQPSVIARLEPKKTPLVQDVVILGAHFDTITYIKGTGSLYKGGKGLNPGADDCASGSSVVFETLRVLVTKQFVPNRPLEFHWYAGEEEGLYGSEEIAADYANRGVPVFAYLNLDQSGYLKPGTTPVIGIMTDYVDDKATAFLRLTAAAYSGYPSKNIVNTKCGYACTDHASWHAHGYPSALAFEGTLSSSFQNYDKVKSDGGFLDTIDVINYDHLSAFIKNSIGYLVELSLTGR